MSVEAPVSPGEVLAQKYRVDRVLGAGGMGVVVAATHVDLGQKVALKFLLPAALANEEAAARFLREARAAVKIESEHVARVLDVGRLESGAPYMVMEYLQGHDLSDHPKGNELPIEVAVDFVLQACEAMAVAHTCGIIHRDLKPANLFLTTRPDGAMSIKVLDFGISKVTETEGTGKELTHTSSVMGSPLYMSPEQMRSSRKVDVRTDIWSLGAILYELLTGEPPFDGETIGEVFAAVMTQEPEPVRARRPECPEGLERLVMRALAKDLNRRFQNVGELARALSEFAAPRSRVLADRASGVLSRAGVSMADTALPPSAPPAAGARTAQAWSETGAGGAPAKSRAPVFVGLGLAALVALGGAFFAMSGRASPTAEPAAPAAAAPMAVAPESVAAAVAAPVAAAPPAPVVEPAPAPSVEPAPEPQALPVLGQPKAAARKATPPGAKTTLAAAPVPAAPATPAPAAPPPAKPAAGPAKNPLSIEFK